MKIIVTGASGFLGRNLLLNLPREWKVFGGYYQTAGFPDFLRANQLDHIQPVFCDLTQPEQTKKIAAKIGREFDVCVYLAANANPASSVENPSLDVEANLTALLNFLISFKIKRFVFFSSGAVYDGLKGHVSPASTPNPQLPYAIDKWAAEQYVKFFQKRGHIKEYMILRFFGAFGRFEPSRKIYTKLVSAFYRKKKKTFVVRGDGRNLVDAMYIDDAIAGLMKVIRSPRKNLVVDFCSGTPVTLDDLVRTAARAFGQNLPEIKHQDSVPEYIEFYASSRAMERYFGFKPKTTLSEGLRKFAQYF